MPQTLTTCHSSHFYVFSPVKISKMWIFGYLLNSPLKKMKKCQFAQGKSVFKRLKICTYRFLGMPIAMHYVRTLCDKYFLSYDGFSCLLWSSVFNRPSLVLMSMFSLQYTVFSFQEYVFSCLKLSPFLQNIPKYSLLSSSLLHNTLNKVVWTLNDDWLPGELLHTKDLLPGRVTIQFC